MYTSRMPAQSTPPTLRVAAASDLQSVFDKLRTAFQRAHSDIRVEVAFGSSGSLFAQLNNQAPFDVFMSADADYPRKLCEAGAAKAENLFSYAIGHLVVWVPRESAISLEQDGLQALLAPGVKKVAIANPEFAPYGRAARAALQRAGIYEGLRDKLVVGDNIAQTAQFVQSGAADAGILSLSLALSPALRDHGRYWAIPSEMYPRLEQVGVIMHAARDLGIAQTWRGFVLGDEARAILRESGFSVDP